MTDYIVEKRENDSYSRWNITKYVEYRRARAFPDSPRLEMDHPTLGNSFKRGRRETLKIIKVVKHWHAGFYLIGVMKLMIQEVMEQLWSKTSTRSIRSYLDRWTNLTSSRKYSHEKY